MQATVARRLWDEQEDPQRASGVVKAWTEWMFELARREVCPEGSSQLHTLWAFAHPLVAFAFPEETADGYAVFEAQIDGGVPWRIVDMNAFQLNQPENAAGLAGAEPEVVGRARS